MTKLKNNNIKKIEKVVVAKYQEDGGYYDNLTYFLENHNEFRNHFDIDKELEEIDNDYIEEYMEGTMQDDCEIHYEDYAYNLKSELRQLGSNWVIEATNINWRGASGELETDDMDKVVSSTLFHDGQCNTTIWKDTEVSFGSAHIPEAHTKILQGVSYHHDCPTGTWFTIKGI